MDALTPDIRRVAPTDPRLAELFERHLGLMHASSPARSVHAKTPDDLGPGDFVAVFEAGEAVAMGALVELGGDHGEIKSMYVLADRRGSGLADAILARLLAEARERGMTRVSLETGSQPDFAPARALYARHGFVPTGPFGDYTDDPNSHYMTRHI